MENTHAMSSAMPLDATMPQAKVAAKKKEHWLVEVVGGLTVATSLVSALSLWYVFLVYVLPVTS